MTVLATTMATTTIVLLLMYRLCYMIYKNGRMRGRIKERSIMTSHDLINPIYETSTAEEEDPCKKGEAVEDNGECPSSKKENSYEEELQQ